MNNILKIAIQVVLVALVVFLVWKVYNSIMEPVKYEKVKTAREKVIIEKLEKIKTLQIEYKKLHDKYSDNFDSLKMFYLNDSMPIIKKVGEIDTLSEIEALELGLISRDTTYIAFKDTLFKDAEEFKIENVHLVPFTHGKVSFDIDAGEITRANYKVPVFEVSCKMKDYLADIKFEKLRDNEINIINKEDDGFAGLKLGSMTEASTDGSW